LFLFSAQEHTVNANAHPIAHRAPAWCVAVGVLNILAAQTPEVAALNAAGERSGSFRIGETVKLNVLNPNGSPPICHSTATVRDLREVFRGKGLELQKQEDSRWNRVETRGFIDEPAFHLSLLRPLRTHEREWRSRTSGTYRARFAYYYASNGTCPDGLLRTSPEVVYSQPFSVSSAAGGSSPPPADFVRLIRITRAPADPLHRGANVEFVATLEYGMESADSGLLSLWVDWFSTQNTCTEAAFHRTVASQRVSVDRGGGVREIRLSVRISQPSGAMAAGVTMFGRNSAMVAESHDYTNYCYQID
jgi:hypothetical protein